MTPIDYVLPGVALAPAALMSLAAVLLACRAGNGVPAWPVLRALAALALFFALARLLMLWAVGTGMQSNEPAGWMNWLAPGQLSAWMGALVQLLSTVIGVFSARYLQGEPGQARYAVAFASVLASVHLLLLANHWGLLIAAWAAVGLFLNQLLCFYKDRPFAKLAAHKKRLADRLADLLLLVAAGLAWQAVGSGSLSVLWAHLAHQGASLALQASAVCFVLAVILRTALFPIHGWLIQVMEAPTPVSALLHAGVVNLGGYLLIRFAPLLEASSGARWFLVLFGLATGVLAGLVMLTRISIKVRLAWSTLAQMGFMVLECGLGLYALAALHLIGHSIYKAHAFLSASSAVRNTRLQMMRGRSESAAPSLILAPIASFAIVMLVQALLIAGGWPGWWNGVLALAWAPLLWVPAASGREVNTLWVRAGFGIVLVALLTAVSALAHRLPLGVVDALPHHAGGMIALIGMALLYLSLATLQWCPERFATWRRWSYAGFYVDEFYTRFALWLWPTRWTPSDATPKRPSATGTQPVVNEK